MEAAPAFEAVRRWLTSGADTPPDQTSLLEAFCRELNSNGIPVDRAMYSVGTLHPQILAFTYIWRRGDGAAEADATEVSKVERSAQDIVRHPDYLRSPIKAVHDGAEEMHLPVSLDLQSPEAREDPDPFPIITGLRAQGFTDYVAFPVEFADGVRNVLSFATCHPEGFTEPVLAGFREIMPLFRLQSEVRAHRRTAMGLLDTYVGRAAGERILRGQVMRGQGEQIHAVIWYADLRGFTALSDKLPMEEVIVLLDDWFEAMTQAIHAHGGQVLKFIGDGLLAIFPLSDAAFRHYTVRQALLAAGEAEAAIEKLNQSRDAPPLDYRLALHVGTLMWGNIGAVDRLDFTAIGPSVNLAARLEALCGELGINLLMSRDFAEIASNTHEIVSLGPHPLRGVAEPQEVFALSSEVAEAEKAASAGQAHA